MAKIIETINSTQLNMEQMMKINKMSASFFQPAIENLNQEKEVHLQN